MPVAEIILGESLKFLVKMLTSQELLNFARRENIHDLLIKWRRLLVLIDAVLADAEEKQTTTDQTGVRLWLEDLEDLAYDMDDILDEISTEALRQNVLKESRASTSKVRALIPTSITRLNPSTLVSDFRMRSNMDEITRRLKDLFDQKIGLGLQNSDAVHTTRPPQRPPSSCLIHEPRVCGRDEDQKAIIELLLSDQSNNGNFGVVPIVGMGGVGKTTLAQMVYNSKVAECFEMKGWVCVSENYDIIEVTKAILVSITNHPCDLLTLNEVQVQLKKALTGKKFLIVLDDFWNEHHGDWSSLKSPFNDGALGSKVIVTTRNRDVACMMTGTDKYHPLKELSENDCWSVFAQLAFENRSIDESSNLVLLGRKIVKKCRGLPLAARTLGGLLRCKLGEDEWEEVLNSKIWELSDKESDILPALRLSYYHLPLHLKKCFGYCSVLSKDYEFGERELVLMWMAEGLIKKPTGQKQMEDLGCEYFRELLSRSFFQPSSSVGVSLFVMHDLVNELAQFVAGRICFKLEEKLENNEGGEIITTARYLSYTRGKYDGIKKFKAFEKAKNARSFLPFGSSDRGTNWSSSYLTSYVPLQLLPKLRRLRVLSLRYYLTPELSSSIGDLKHVRFLDLSCALIVRLPESIGTLYNLETLILRDCKNLSKLPTNTSNLINLRHLDVTGANSLQEMPPKMGKLTSLQTLSHFIVSQSGGGSTVNELGNLIHLRGQLHISGLENVSNALHARRANLKDKLRLDSLFMRWSNIAGCTHNVTVESEVLNMLRPHDKLKELTISGYHGLKFPTWVGNPMFCNVVYLKFHNFENCAYLPPLGQLPSLENLFIQEMKAVENVGLEFYGSSCSNPFPALKILTLEDMPEWKYWSPFEGEKGAQAFSRLSKLSIKRCPNLLGRLPSNLPCLKELDIEDCPLQEVAWASGPKEVIEVNNRLQFDTLISLSLNDALIPDSFGNEAVLENARYSNLNSLTSLRVENVQGLVCLHNWFFEGLTGLQELSLCGCKELTLLWKNKVRRQHHLPALRRLVVEGCSQLVSLFEEEEEEALQQQNQHEEPPYLMMLKYLEIKDCEKLEKLPRGLHSVKYLQGLIIRTCPCLISFPTKGLPSTLRKLCIESCDALRFLPELMMLNSLKKLEVSKCPSLTYLSCSRTGLPPNLDTLRIEGCVKLELILAEEGIEINCPSLQTVEIKQCGSLKSLPEVMQHDNGGSLKNLRQLWIIGCDMVESIPEGWFNATNLRQLRIQNCKKLKDLPENAYKSLEGLQISGYASATRLISCILKEESSLYFTNLTYLCLDNVDMGENRPPSEWGLHRLSSLKELSLTGYGWPSFPPKEEETDGMLLWLPLYLSQLRIRFFPNLENLSGKDFQNIPSLELLQIENCPKLRTITELGLLSSLPILEINNCPNLASFSEEEHEGRLPPSLWALWIKECPVMKKRCDRSRAAMENVLCFFLKRFSEVILCNKRKGDVMRSGERVMLLWMAIFSGATYFATRGRGRETPFNSYSFRTNNLEFHVVIFQIVVLSTLKSPRVFNARDVFN